MDSPIILPGGLDVHLDALLAYAWMLRHCPERKSLLARSTPRRDIIFAHIPVRRIRVGQHAIPLATAWMLPESARLTPARWTRRKDGEDMERRSRTINASCLERGMYLRGDQIETDVVEWLAWGDRRAIVRDLRLVHQIGGKRAHGAGMIRSWSVVSADISPVDTWVAGDRVVRNLPAEAISSECHERCAVEPPYWPACMQVLGAAVGTHATLTVEVLSALECVV